MPKSKNKRKSGIVKKPHKNHSPSSKLNNNQMRRKIEELVKGLELQKNQLSAISKQHALHLTLLSNFASHDLKNYIHSIDGIVNTTNASTIQDNQLDSIRYNIALMRDTLDNFKSLIMHNDANECYLDEVTKAITILNKSSFQEQGITYETQIPDELDVKFHLPFTAVLQIMNNLVINAIKALENVPSNKKIMIKVTIQDEFVLIETFDNAPQISDSLIDKIFEYAFTTTNGSGIGLFHARYLCEMYEGSLTYHNVHDLEFTKCFAIKLPLIKDA